MSIVAIVGPLLLIAALFRDRRMNKNVPASVSRIVVATPDSNDA